MDLNDSDEDEIEGKFAIGIGENAKEILIARLDECDESIEIMAKLASNKIVKTTGLAYCFFNLVNFKTFCESNNLEILSQPYMDRYHTFGIFCWLTRKQNF